MSIISICKNCNTQFTPSKGLRNYCKESCKPRTPVAGWNKGIKGSTGDHKGINNSYHKMTAEQKKTFARLGNQKVNSQSHLYTEKKRKAMAKKFDEGYKISPLAGYGIDREAPEQELSESARIHLDKLFGII